MNNRKEKPFGPDPAGKPSASMADVAERAQRLVVDFLTRHGPEIASSTTPDPLNIGNAFLEMTARLMADPVRIAQAQMSLWQDYLGLWQNAAARMMGLDSTPFAEPERGDRRFKDAAWSDNQVFDFVKQSYLLTARWLQSTVRDVEGLDRRTAKKIDFYTRQFVEALSPTNFVMTNPEVLRATMESGGDNLLRGLTNLLADLERGKGRLAIRMTDMDAFEVGKNIAVSPGKVVFRNDLMELIQYQPSTAKVRKAPLLIIPPWINKFYILDLRQENSFIKYAVDQGHTVFVISWVNPDAKLAAKTFDDYMLEGPIAALEAIERATGETGVNAVGYCIGGTLLACTLAYMAAKGDAKLTTRIKSATFFTSMVDFADSGELGVFIDEQQLAILDNAMSKRGFLEGNEMAAAFNMMRGTDLIWSFVVNNYLLGKEPFPFDLLYWNSDSTRMPAAMHSFYLRAMYHENRLSQPGGITLANIALDLRKIKTPTYIMATREDHIAPWKSAYVATQLYGGPKRFVLAASGHIAGVVNPPAAKKYCHWLNDKTPKDPDDWLARATQREGSWWPDWDEWVKAYAGGEVPARVPGQGGLKALADAPGEYVRMRLVNS
ncbi:MAG: class I poly(R)-hydroxyalkanoic acid synthase [Alphaproteobacteria bacterium]|nr:class I poly(R)-hydroxyalkanoic acid synthase [Alphaproteobacteria bacterium]